MTAYEVTTPPRRSGKRPVLVATLVSFLVLLSYGIKAWTFATALTVALLGLTIVLDVLVLWQHRTARISRKLGAYELVKAGLLLAYWLGKPIFDKWSFAASFCSGLALVAALAITVSLMDTAQAMIRQKNPPRHTGLWELLNDKVIALTGLVLAFLHITYALTFALAFSDRYIGGQLYAVQLDSGSEPKTTKPQDCKSPSVWHVDGEKRVQKFFFSQSHITLSCTLKLKKAADAEEPLRRALCNGGVDARLEAFQHVHDGECDGLPDAANLRRAAVWNLREMYELRERFRKLACDGQGSYLVEIRGHANDIALKDNAYSSNYEISKQRADQIALLLNALAREAADGVSTPVIRWLSYGVSNEDSFLAPDSGDWPDAKLDKKLSVEVNVQPVADSFEVQRLRAATTTKRDLELIDYLYFTVYTITTTGYGDIIPTSSYAKFIVTIANLIELLFVVVLVNVIANTRIDAAAITADETPKGADDADDA